MIRDTEKLIVCPGVYDGLSARIAHEVGFDSLYMTGAGTSASRLGMADLGLATLSDMRAHAEMISNLKPNGAPIIADMDTGYGGPMMVYRAVCEYIRAGVAGFHLEDQLLTKRCGHLKGKEVVSREDYYARIRAAQAARVHMGSDIVLIARTDALQSRGYDECVARLKVARELGADVGLLEGFTSREQASSCVKEFQGWPLLLNSVENGASPLITVDEAREMGFRIMIFSFASIAPAYQAIKATFERLKTDGVIGTKGEITPKKIFDVCGLGDLVDIEVGSGSSVYAKDNI
ncbi:oxaloacetate acetylhydrose [Polychaeton citri CBS 116435]|uniref:Oxaloacetate acetylhydrose n=1 Tax=Polychaeton citri CBS 116435 TaxID=1314669 RepID=A0A9P4QIT5_9PEZI|nr:oxaloacetate acetylhydrose [Polychaeton citri CBS 116435]